MDLEQLTPCRPGCQTLLCFIRFIFSSNRVFDLYLEKKCSHFQNNIRLLNRVRLLLTFSLFRVECHFITKNEECDKSWSCLVWVQTSNPLKYSLISLLCGFFSFPSVCFGTVLEVYKPASFKCTIRLLVPSIPRYSSKGFKNVCFVVFLPIISRIESIIFNSYQSVALLHYTKPIMNFTQSSSLP